MSLIKNYGRLLFFGIILSLISCKLTEKKARPNIIIIMSDDHAKKAISCYNDQLLQTPNIDRLAREGMRFDNAFVTNALCAPSRATMLTGKHSHLNGLRDNRDVFDPDQVTFPKFANHQIPVVWI